ncbi:MAG TPA: glycosyltransferase [Puia sp.]
MHYGLVAIGSRGDVQPFISLALGLIDTGHKVTIVAHENFKEFVESYDLQFKPLFGNVEEVLHSPEGKKALNSGSSIAMLKYIEKIGRKTQKQINQDILKGCEEAEVIVSSALGAAWVYSIAEKTGKKWAIVQLSFPVTPTTEFPFAGMDYFNFPRFNLFTYRMLLKVYWKFNRYQINEFRNSLGLTVLTESIIKKIEEKQILTLYCVSPTLIPRPKDWSENVKVTGFLTPPFKSREKNNLEKIPEALQNWIKNGEKPIYIGFGSMPVPNVEKFNKILSELVSRGNHRFIFCYGWSGVPDLVASPNLYSLPYINHEWLFPQCKVAIIHGGVGTTAAVLKAGIPVIVLSVFGDQPWWGKLIERRKLGIHMPFKKMTRQNLVNAIDQTQTPEILTNAKQIGTQINNEDGLKLTIDALANYFNLTLSQKNN